MPQLVELMVWHPRCEVSLAATPLPAHSESRQSFDPRHRLRLHLQQLGDLFESQSLFVHPCAVNQSWLVFGVILSRNLADR
jgi:hypothetical protein